MLHRAGVILGRTAPPQALIGIILRRAAVRCERAGISFRAIAVRDRKIAVIGSLRHVSLRVTMVSGCSESFLPARLGHPKSTGNCAEQSCVRI